MSTSSRRAILGAAATLPPRSPQREAMWTQVYALSGDWHRIMDQVIDTPARTEAGRSAKARRVLKWADLDADGWPIGDDALPWSLARDVLGIVS